MHARIFNRSSLQRKSSLIISETFILNAFLSATKKITDSFVKIQKRKQQTNY